MLISGRSRAFLLLLALALLPGVVAGADQVEDRLWDLQLIPLDPEPAPAFTLDSLEDGKLSLADLRGRVLLLYFFATW